MTDALAGLRLATGTLTMVPVGELGQPSRRRAGWAMALAGVAALPLAAAAALVGWLGELAQLPRLVTAGLVLVCLGLGSRAMHLDGLADTTDGIGGGWDRDRALDIMRRGDVGPMGAAAVALTLVVQAGAAAGVLSAPRGWALVGVAVVASRSSCALACVRGVPAARDAGMGAVVAGAVPRLVAVAVVALTTALLATGSQLTGSGPWPGVAASAVLVVTVGLVLRTAIRIFGGITGDVIGAAIELSLVAVLVVLSTGLGR